MARRRGKQKGSLRIEGPSWVGYWNEWDAARQDWAKRSQVICAARIRGKDVTKKQAQRLFEETVLDDLDVHNTHPMSSATVEYLWKKKYQDSLRSLEPRGIAFYESVMRLHILPVIGGYELRDVDFSVVEVVVNEAKAKGLSTQMLRHIRNSITRMFKYAKRLKWYSGDLPTEGITLPKVRTREKPILSEIQMQALLRQLEWWTKRDGRCVLYDAGERLADRKDGYVPLWELALLLSRTGIRIGEAAGLRWLRMNLSDEVRTVNGVMLEPRFMAVTDNLVTAPKKILPEGRQYGPVKTRAGMRLIPLPPSVVRVLKPLRAMAGPMDPVFPGRTGEPIRYENYARRVLKPIGEKLGIPWISWHIFRHTANTLARVEKMSIGDRQRVFGWNDKDMAAHYDHLVVESLRAGIDRLDERLSGGREVVQ